MMATTAMQLAISAFGPITDNAGGIAEMSELPKEVRAHTNILNVLGNTTSAAWPRYGWKTSAPKSLPVHMCAAPKI